MLPVFLFASFIGAQEPELGAMVAAARYAAHEISLAEYVIDREQTGAVAGGRGSSSTAALADTLASMLGTVALSRNKVVICDRPTTKSFAKCRLTGRKALMRVGPLKVIDGKQVVSVWVHQNTQNAVQLLWLQLEMQRGSEGWQVVRIIGKGAS